MGKCFTKVDHSDTKESIPSNPKIETSAEFNILKQIPNFPMSPIARRTIISSLKKSPLFRNLSLPDIENILKQVKFCICEGNKTIFSQGDKGSLYFIINSGRVQVIVDGKSKGILEAESCFGEMALLSDSIRKASILTLSKCSFWVLTGNNFFQALKSYSKKSYDQIRGMIANSIVFKNLNEGKIDLISKMSMTTVFQDQEFVIREGDAGDLIYILTKGCITFKKGTEEYMRISKPGDIFGEGALLTGEPRKSTCSSVGTSELITINYINLKTIFGPDLDSLLLKNLSKNSLASDSHLNFLRKSYILDICENLEWKKFKDSQVVLTKTNEDFHILYIICTGCLRHASIPNSIVPSYQVIGLKNENEQFMKEGDYLAVGQTIIGQIELSLINKLLKINCFELVGKLDKMRLLRSISYFNCLSEESANNLAEKMKNYIVLEGTKIFSCEDRGGKVYLVKSGVFEVYDSQKKLLRIIKGNEVFGERCLYEEKRSADVVCIQRGEMFNVTRTDLQALKEAAELVQLAKRKEYYQRKVNFETMVVVREYLAGHGRKRYCIKDPVDKLRYELITIPMASLESKRDCFRLVQEREIMIQIEHRQLVKLVCSTHKNDCVYFITEHIKGNSLNALLPVNPMACKQLALYFAKMIEYLHDKNIAYRDFCTENIIISANGIPYLYNFRSAKIVENRTYTRVGNHFIRSPEMILGRGYSKSTDIWSFGVVLYELVYNKLPFQMKELDSPIEAYEKILNLNHGFNDFVDRDANKLLEFMLSNSDLRVDINGILRNSWFSGVEKNFLKKRPTMCDNIFGMKIKEEKRYKKVFKANKLLLVFYK